MEILAFDIGGTQGRCAAADRSGRYADVQTLQRDPAEDGARWLDRLLAAGKQLAAKHPTFKTVAISFGGPVGLDGRIQSMHVGGWEKVNLKQAMADAFKLPVLIENDANCGALGEFHFGAGRGCRYLAYFTVSTGIGGGVILDGKLYRGAHGLAAEFGQMTLHPGPNAPQYAFGKPGVLEALACGPAIARDAQQALRSAGKTNENLSAKDVFAAAANNKAWARAVLDNAISHLARGVAVVICAYDVERVILGGGVALAGETLFAPLRKKVREFTPRYLENTCEVLPAELGDHSALLGAVALTL